MAQVTTAPSDYPVQLTITDERTLSRWWGIPYFGMVVRFILLIPHLVVMAVLGIGMYVVLLVGWIPILLTGRVPALQAKWIKETIHRSTRVTGYGPYLMPGGYPPLGVGEVGPTDLRIDIGDGSINRWWGIPLFGLLARVLLAIPHLVVLSIIMIVGVLGVFVLWIPILISGRYPEWAATLYSGLLRYQVRVGAYIMLLPVPYPPFSLK